MGKNLVQKIVDEHLVAGTPESGEPVSLRIDQTLLQDATGTLACLQFEQLGLDRVQVPFAVQYIDHNILQIDFKNPDDHRFLQGICGRYGIHYSRPGNGICHYLHIERFATPGATLIGADSHTTTSGALGMLAIGAGGLDVAVVMGGQPFEIEMPRVVGVELRGKLQPWVTAKDIILELLRRRGVAGGLGRVFEFHGDGVATLDVTQRATICNMCAELGATTGIFPSDDRTRDWLEAQQRSEDYAPMAADADATYDETEVIDLAQLEPLIAKPSSPGSVVPVREVEGTKAAQVCIGSSVNSGYGDLAIAAAVLRGQSVHPSLVMTVTPGSRQILDTLAATGVYTDLVQAGARMLEPACGPCVGMGQAPPSGAVSVRTFNRNFPGRSGTTDDQVYLCSPTTAAATALFGVITDPRKLGEAEPAYPAPVFNPRADDGQIIEPLSASEAARIEIVRGPNIQPPPEQTPLPAALSGRVLTVLGDDVPTGDLSPDGAEVMAFRSNIEKMASFVFRRLDPEFPQRAKEWGGGFVVGGANYGQGSSREHAAVAPRYLGVLAVIAKSFARIHRRNLVNFGILPLTFVDDADYAAIAQGDELKIADVRKSIEAGAGTLTIENTTKKSSFEVSTGYSPRQREILLAGGLLNFVKALAVPS